MKRMSTKWKLSEIKPIDKVSPEANQWEDELSKVLSPICQISFQTFPFIPIAVALIQNVNFSHPKSQHFVLVSLPLLDHSIQGSDHPQTAIPIVLDNTDALILFEL